MRLVRAVLLLMPLAGCQPISSPEVSRTTILLSVTSSGDQADGASSVSWISDDGSAVAFVSSATNLVQDQATASPHLYVKNRTTGSVELATRNSDQGDVPVSCFPSQVFISATGRYVVFVTDTPPDTGAPSVGGNANIFIRDLELRLTYRAIDRTIWPNSPCTFPSISENGRFVTFASAASNLGKGSPGNEQIFVSDLSTNPPTLYLVSHAQGFAATHANGACAEPWISADGQTICYSSRATNLQLLADPDTTSDVYIAQFDAAFTSISDSSVVSLNAGGTKGNGDSTETHMSANARYVVFVTVAANMGVGSNNVMRRDLSTGQTVCMTVTADALGPDNAVSFPRVSGNGDVVFLSNASNLTGNTGGLFQPYIVTSLGFEQVSISDAGKLATAAASPFISISSGGGVWVVWNSTASNLVLPDKNGTTDAFARGPWHRHP